MEELRVSLCLIWTLKHEPLACVPVIKGVNYRETVLSEFEHCDDRRSQGTVGSAIPATIDIDAERHRRPAERAGQGVCRNLGPDFVLTSVLSWKF